MRERLGRYRKAVESGAPTAETERLYLDAVRLLDVEKKRVSYLESEITRLRRSQILGKVTR